MGKKNLDPAIQHQIKIAKQTLKMNDIFARIMGGMTKEEARTILRKYGINPDKFEGETQNA